MKIVIKPIEVKIDTKAFEKALKKMLDQEAESIRESYENTVKTWRHKPDFKKYVRVTQQQVYLSVTTQDKIYRYIEFGTRVRRAIMSKNWVSKTRPNRLTPGGGAGHVVFISKKVKRPGIKARNYSKLIWKNRKARFTKAMRQAFGEGAKAFVKPSGRRP